MRSHAVLYGSFVAIQHYDNDSSNTSIISAKITNMW